MSMELKTCIECDEVRPYYVGVKKQNPKAKWTFVCSVDCTVKFIRKMQWKEYQIVVNPILDAQQKQDILRQITNQLIAEPENVV